ncbi:MAG: LysM peptidoglycan-binding domain-containing protein [Ilumatobacter sp.]|nr:LysM peptidoglycan-binding domain-containing protein [Ilumatobacter sp.]
MSALRRLAFTVVLGVLGGTMALPTVTQAAENRTYVVANGDTLFGIASQSGIRLSELLRANDLQINSLILAGQRLTIPTSSSPTSSTNTTTAASTPTPVAGSGPAHVVKWGDTLIGIARHNGVALSALLKANRLSLSSLIMPGMKLSLPEGATTTPTSAPSQSPMPSAAPNPSEATYVVRAGDTLSGIASRHGATLKSLLDVNEMSVTSLIVPGMRVALPSGSTVPTPAEVATTDEPSSNTGVAAVVNYALAQVGKPYRFFTKGPDAFDCSGLTLAAYERVGIQLVHFSAWQARQGTEVDFLNEPIQPGDLVFQANRGSETINHVGMAVTSTTWIHARATGYPVQVGSMPAKSTIVAVRRFIEAG